MGLFDFWKKQEAVLGVDIGVTSIRLVELDLTLEKPRLVNIAKAPLSADVFQNQLIVKPEIVADLLQGLLDQHAIEDRRVVVAMPGPSVFTKRIKLNNVPLGDLADTVRLEAANFIPHNIDAVKMDYHIIGEASRNQLDMLVVAVKNEIVDSYVDAIAMSGLDTAVVDIDYFALQNAFELAYPDLIPKTVALIHIGSRYSSINICRNGQSLFAGDISIGGRAFTDSIAEGLGVSPEEAERLKRAQNLPEEQASNLRDIVEKQLEYVASEYNRQLSFYWSASGSDEGIDRIMLSGGGSQIAGLTEELTEKTGVQCEILDPFRNLDVGVGTDPAVLKSLAPEMALAVGMSLRQAGDRTIPDYVES